MTGFVKKIRPYLTRHMTGRNLLLLIPGIIGYFVISILFKEDTLMHKTLIKAVVSYNTIMMLVTANSFLLVFSDAYSTSTKNRKHPLKGLVQGLQVIMFFVGAIIVVAVLLGKSPKVLLTGLGASAAVLMLVFKDSILGFVAGVQLSQNNMVRIGDWIQLPDGSANGTVEEITLNTVKVRNWDNTLTMIPPYTLVSSPFKNWRGMQESGGRRVSKKIYIDMKSIRNCNGDTTTNTQSYRTYIEQYLRAHPVVAQDLDIIIAQREPTQFGLPIEVYFFLTDKVWNEFEKIQSDIFDHFIAMAPRFGLKLYQLPS